MTTAGDGTNHLWERLLLVFSFFVGICGKASAGRVGSLKRKQL